MCKKCPNTAQKALLEAGKKPLSGPSLDKYAQLGKMARNGMMEAEEMPELEQSTTIDKQDKLIKRKKRKFLSHHLALNLINANKAQREIELDELQEFFEQNPQLTTEEKTEKHFETENKDRQIMRSYWNMYRCNREMVKDSKGNVKTRYCKNRLCLICNSIRTAALLDKYAPIFEAWEDELFMVTLTIENCEANQLKASIDEMQKSFIKAKDSIKKLHQKGRAKKFEGLRKLECTSLRENDFHPHFHILVRGEENAYLLRDYWVEVVQKSKIISCKLKGWDEKEQRHVELQRVDKAFGNIGKELFKYFTKIISTSSKEKGNFIYTNRLDTIFKAMKGKRVFQTFGFKIKDYEIRKFLPAPSPPVEAQRELDIQYKIERLVYKLRKNRVLTDKEVQGVIKRIEHKYKDIPDFLSLYLSDEFTKEQLDINQLFDDFYKKQRTAKTALDLMLNLYVYECNYKSQFESEKLPTRAIPIFNKQDKEKLFILHQTFSKSSKGSAAALQFQSDFHALEANRSFDLKLEESEADLSHLQELEEQVFVFDGDSGNWIDHETGETLISYRLGDTFKKLKDKFLIPSKYRNKLFQLWVDG
jgi:hypothetical protein